MYRYLAALVLATSVGAQFQTAQQYPPAGYPQYQPPDNQGQEEIATDEQHGVARISVAQGDVNVKRGDTGQLTGAIMNAPMMSQDHLETSPGSRAELQFDGENVLRMGPNTDLGIANLAYQRYQVQLGMGTIIVRVLADSQAHFEIDTPSVAFHPTAQGEYRISVFDNGTSQISVRAGRIEMSGPRGSQLVNQGQSLLVRGDAADPEFQEVYEAPHDQLDDWSASRDAELMSARSSQYVNADMGGAGDLDHYGNWVPSQQYGQVWVPQGEAADWSPYSNGQWTYADYYGWTWVGYEPWGWAPYHYGRWFWNTGYGWCWWPGARGFHHWSPALVSFFGFGGGLGWVSLAPYEAFHPWWGRGYRSFDSYRAYDLGRYYRNAAVRGGALTASFGAFGGAGHRYSIATRGQLGAADLYRGRIPVSPNAGSYRLSDRPVAANTRLAQGASRQFFSRQPFSAPRASSPAASGWQHFGSPGNFAPQPRQSFANRPYSNNESGWHSFGQPQSPAAPHYNYSAPAQRYNYNQTAPRYNNAPATQRYSAPATPRYNAPAAPHYSAPAQHYSAPAPRSAPSYRGNEGGRSNGGGGGNSGGGHSSGGGSGGRRR